MELENRLNAITGQLETAAATRQVAQDMKKVSLSLQKINQKDLGLEKVCIVPRGASLVLFAIIMHDFDTSFGWRLLTLLGIRCNGEFQHTNRTA